MRDSGSRARGVGFGTCSAQEVPHGSFPLPKGQFSRMGDTRPFGTVGRAAHSVPTLSRKNPEGGRAGEKSFATDSLSAYS